MLGLEHALEQDAASACVEESGRVVLFHGSRERRIFATDRPCAGRKALAPHVLAGLHVVQAKHLAALWFVLVQEQTPAKGSDATGVQRAEVRNRYGHTVLGTQCPHFRWDIAAGWLDDVNVLVVAENLGAERHIRLCPKDARTR